MKLIFNADDFGLTESVNHGIVDCFKAGIVKSTTIMMNQPGTQHAVELYHQGLVPEVGLHFTVTSGKPLTPPELVSSLVDEHGDFLDKATLFDKSDVVEKEVELELNAQYQAALSAGLKINHIDSHHFGGVYKALKAAFTRTVNDIGLPVRRIDNILSGQDLLSVPTPDAFDMRFFDGGISLTDLQNVLLSHQSTTPNGIIELMCHPSLAASDELKSLSGYHEKRVEEHALLTSPTLKQWLADNHIECIGFDDLTQI
ncbi:carbohydrate deacetylase [Vibrio sp. 10N.261.46.E12]|uniref:carbohydrate deacetylase n=1 Tax=unclassified Vibrio TaxID=2614977 RepID=UPI00097691D0|nr:MULTISPECIES: carbohydrate deacetylase [unclassified Vibrio]OMO33810.1 PTS cellbiose transporter [Vibrio sp. 10N.261.45.E1]PMJ19564.1 PTS cellbiose transporter [Vibrio sp. 10N.286.45.B6]PML93936.1 PTS cellbiose transporter [Vibrio sp. 10N.261.49.E11]PMM77721.1 PTS cellbiose transporter [Vibrio sp. 10N.261.46.F12]PMM81010.1 PTS cellbiose transporter [Vibrio sp. 10N.261.46.E8]